MQLGTREENDSYVEIPSNTTPYSLGLRVKNEGADEAVNCQGTLVCLELINTNSDQYNVSSLPLTKALLWTRENRFTGNGSVCIPGNSEAVLEVATCDSDNYLRFSYATGCEASRAQHQISRIGDILAVIEVTSQNSQPIYAICLLEKLIFFYDIKLLQTTDTKPNIEYCRSLISDKGDSQTV